MTEPGELGKIEFSVLRQTIAVRGTVRMVLAAATFFLWTAVTLVLMLFSELPVAAVLSLAVLVAGFEAIHALHAGAERIGRYIQVFYEGAESPAAAGRPSWETTAMQSGRALPGGGVDPLFTILFLCATAVSFMTSLLPSPTPLESGVVGVLHLAFGVRVLGARIAAGKQRAADLEHYRALLLRQRDRE